MTERRYGDDEIREILDRATRRVADRHLPVTDRSGLTLAELQEVGREVGVPPERIANAAAAIDTRRETLPRGSALGMPTSVGRVVELPRAPTDHEWAVLVADLRETFGATGSVKVGGGVREWSNGNLHAFVEPTVTGYRLRLGTLKGTARPTIVFGSVALIVGLLLLVLFIGEQLPPAAAVAALISTVGGGTLGSAALRLPRWASERERQMEHISGRAIALLAEGP